MSSFKITVTLLAGFLVSACGVVAAYTPLSGLLKGFYWQWALRDLPVFSAASANLVSAWLVLLMAFWGSAGELRNFRAAIFAYSFFFPFIVVLWFLPGEQHKPEWATLNWGIAFATFFAVQIGIAKLLQSEVWLRGGRSAA